MPSNYTLTCRHCGTEYTHYHDRKVFCTPECRSAHREENKDKNLNQNGIWIEIEQKLLETGTLKKRLDTQDWVTILSDQDNLARILRSVIAMVDRPSGRGSRPPLKALGADQLAEFLHTGYSTKPFPEALRDRLNAFPSTRPSEHLGVCAATMGALVTGRVTPTLEEMRQYAEALLVTPFYWTEYRQAFLRDAATEHLFNDPVETITIVKSLLKEADLMDKINLWEGES